MSGRKPTRREWLRACTAGGLVSLTGCLRLTSEATGSAETETVSATARRATARSESEETAATTDEPTENGLLTCRTELPPRFAEEVGQQFVDSRNSRYQANVSVSETPPCIGWKQDVEVQSSRVFVGPFIGRENVLLQSYGRLPLQARSKADGSRRWLTNETLTDEYTFLRTLAIRKGTLFAYGQNNRTRDLEFVRVDTESGELLSVKPLITLSDPNRADVTVAKIRGKRAYLAIDDEEEGTTAVRALDIDTGETVWERTLADTPLYLEDMAVDDEVISLTSDEVPEGSDNIWVLSIEDGRALWTERLPIGEAVPVLSHGNLYLPVHAYHIADMENHVRAFDKATGETMWSFEVLNPPRTGVSTDHERVYLIADDQLYGIDPASGSPEWRYTVGDDGYIAGNSSGLPTVCQNGLLVGGRGDTDEGIPARVRAVDKASGEEWWSFGVPEVSVQSPFVADGVMYALAEKERDGGEVNSVLYAFG